MIQQVLVGIIFIAALAYVASLVVKAFKAKSGCAVNCGKCNTIDVDKIEKDIHRRSVAQKVQ